MSRKYYSIRKVNNFMEDKFDIGKYVKFLGNCNIDNYRVTIKERYKVLLHCEPNLRSGDLLRLLGAYQIWSI